MSSPYKIWNRSGLLFGKMWEDSEVEMELAKRIVKERGECRVLAIASSGDTSFAVASIPGVTVESTDINPAQVWLCQLKQGILEELGTEALVKGLYSDVRSVFERIKFHLPGDCRDFWEQNLYLLKDGFHRAGRIDRMMSFWAWLFSKLVVSRNDIDQRLLCEDPIIQRELVDEQWCGWKWDWGIKIAFWQPILRFVYGRDLIEGLPADFSAQISTRLMHFLTGFEAKTNPYLWQTFAKGELGWAAHPYLSNWGPVDFSQGTIAQRVQGCHQKYDLLLLSDILEVAPPRQSRSLLQAIQSSAAPGAKVCLRFMAPRIRVWPDLEFLENRSMALGKSDRAFFCNHIQLYRV